MRENPVIETNGTKHWYLDGKLHRTDGPAIEYADGSKFWRVNGKQINFEEIIERHELNPDWTQWTDSEKVLFRLAV